MVDPVKLRELEAVIADVLRIKADMETKLSGDGLTAYGDGEYDFFDDEISAGVECPVTLIAEAILIRR